MTSGVGASSALLSPRLRKTPPTQPQAAGFLSPGTKAGDDVYLLICIFQFFSSSLSHFHQLFSSQK